MWSLDLTYRSMGKGNTWPTYTTNAMTFQSVLSNFLSCVASSLKHLRVEFSYYAYVMSELAGTTRTFFHYRLLTIRLLEQGYVASRLKLSLFMVVPLIILTVKRNLNLILSLHNICTEYQRCQRLSKLRIVTLL